MIDFGYIYVLENEKVPGLVKIGFTCSLPEERCKDLNSATGVPGKWAIFDQFFVCRDVQVVERHIHTELTRHNVGKEFFKMSPETATAQVRKFVQKFKRLHQNRW